MPPDKPPIPESENLRDYLECSEVLDWHSRDHAVGASLTSSLPTEVAKARRLYEWVRDEIPHSLDARHETVTCRASDVLRHRTGICFAKSHLLSALLRAVGIPTGLCYQVLRFDPSSERLILHGLNGIYLQSLGRWLRVDPRGNKVGVDAQFCENREQLAFPADSALGEYLSPTVYVRPLPGVIQCLCSYDTVTDVLKSLPSAIPSSGR